MSHAATVGCAIINADGVKGWNNIKFKGEASERNLTSKMVPLDFV